MTAPQFKVASHRPGNDSNCDNDHMAALGRTLVGGPTVDIIFQVAQTVNRPEVGTERCLGPMTKVLSRTRY
ncbi:protein of unknown function [Bradyrhizobium vignae]|uniref:Uncharacterized protein n=1 Tax=Bradyrhizobium vignae TaxID=1549949 RepID=A0A2U3PU35_9BRAD|nr:protein of unknown function [Bradyrhizobium vignae]